MRGLILALLFELLAPCPTSLTAWPLRCLQGKGRQAAGIILENWLQGRTRALWFSVSGDLVADAQRDINDIGGGKIKCHNLKDFKAGVSLEKQGLKQGILFCTHSLLISERAGAAKVQKARLQQIVKWSGADAFEGALILDECHRAKNMGCAGVSALRSLRSLFALHSLETETKGVALN